MSGKLLTQVLEQSLHIQDLISQSAKQLSSADGAIEHDSTRSEPLPKADISIGSNQNAAVKLQEAAEMLTAVTQALRIEIRDRIMVDHQLAAAEEQERGSRNAALHDTLTGLPNRVLLQDRLEHAIAQANRHHWILAVMFVDLDNFKEINDTYGHQAGDAVLQSVATRLKHNTRHDDTVSRYGGDEFIYLLTKLQEDKDITMIAAKLLKAIQAPCDVTVNGLIANLCIKVSIGISVFPRDGNTADALIKSADDAMYGVKGSKSGCTVAQ